MVVAVTGASGHLGAALTRELVRRGTRVRAAVRGPARALEGLDIETVKADVLDNQSLRAAFDGVDVVFHLAGIISLASDGSSAVRRTNVGGSKNVVDACLDRNVGRLVHCSSIHAFLSRPRDGCIDESRQLVPWDDHREPLYDRTKAAGQRHVCAGLNKGLNAVIVHPTAVIGPYDFKGSPMGKVIRSLANGTFPALVEGGFDWVDVRDVAVGMCAAASRACSGDSFILSGHYCSIPQLAKMIGAISGVRPPRFVSPMWLARLGAPFAEAWAKLAGNPPVYTSESLLALRRHQEVSCDRARRALNYDPRPLEETIRDTLEWYMVDRTCGERS